ncbi:MAG: YdcF family protein [Verrucomicrobiales bacterium]|nr:YdcF family protein [Verrucomicrobiales bacterium]
MNLKRYLPLLIPALFFLALILLSGPLLLMRKVVVFLCLPAGIVWVLLSFALFLPQISRWHRAFLAIVWIIFTLGGNPLLGNRLVRTLEAPYAKYENPEEPFDILFVLGGGTSTTLSGEPQLGSAGDRVLTAARLYKRGKVKKLVASGRSITEVGKDRSLAGETVAIWTELGIPESDILAFEKPRTTEEEMKVYLEYLNSLPTPPGRIGICTSAWHLKRAQRLWTRYGLEATPVPADFRSKPLPVITTYLIPKKRGFADIQLALWEYLGLMFD